MSMIVATAYMEEAERFDWLVAMNAGKVLATGTPAELKARTGAATIEDAFIALAARRAEGGPSPAGNPAAAAPATMNEAIVARDLTRRFGDFTAVDHVSFDIERGEIFGFLGSNGCGKTTTMKMLTGLLPATDGRRCCSASRSTPMTWPRARASATCRNPSRSIPSSRCGRTSTCTPGCSICRPTGPAPRRRAHSPFRPRRLCRPAARRRCRSASASACRWRSRSCTNRTSSSSMSRPPAWIRWRVMRSGNC